MALNILLCLSESRRVKSQSEKHSEKITPRTNSIFVPKPHAETGKPSAEGQSTEKCTYTLLVTDIMRMKIGVAGR